MSDGFQFQLFASPPRRGERKTFKPMGPSKWGLIVLMVDPVVVEIKLSEVERHLVERSQGFGLVLGHELLDHSDMGAGLFEVMTDESVSQFGISLCVGNSLLLANTLVVGRDASS